jgi:hypothetical protein
MAGGSSGLRRAATINSGCAGKQAQQQPSTAAPWLDAGMTRGGGRLLSLNLAYLPSCLAK